MIPNFDFKNRQIFVIFNQPEILLLKRFLKKNRFFNSADITVVAYNKLVSHYLIKEKINHICFGDLVDSQKEQEISHQATTLLWQRLNSTLTALHSSSIDQDLINFFDCLKFELMLPLQQIYFYQLYFSEVFRRIKPGLVIYYQNHSVPILVLAQQLKQEQLRYAELSINRFFSIVSTIKRFLPLLGREKNHYQFVVDFFNRYNFFKRIYRFYKSRRLLARIEGRTDIATFSFIRFRPEIKEYLLNLALGDKSKPQTALVLASSHLSKSDCLPLLKSKIPNLQPDFSGGLDSTIDQNRFSLFLKTVKEQFFPKDAFPEFFAESFPYLFNLENKYQTYRLAFQYFNDLFNRLKPVLHYCAEEFSFMSRINLLVAKNQGVKTIGFSINSDQLMYAAYFEPLIDLNGSEGIKNFILPDEIWVAGKLIKSAYQRLKFFSGADANVLAKGSFKLKDFYQKRLDIIAAKEQARENILSKLKLPQGSKLILYTGRRFSLSFVYPNLLAEVFLKLKNKYHWQNVYLIIKPHPLEFNFLYFITNHYRFNPNIKIVKNFEIYPAIIASEALVTNFSFTAIEAALLNKPVILLDFLHNHQFSIYHQPIFKKVDNVEALALTIKEILMADQADLFRIKETDLSHYFSPLNSPL